MREPASRTESFEVDGLRVMLDPSFPSPAPRWGYSPEIFLGRNLQVRPRERLLSFAAGSGLVGLYAARSGATVSLLDPEASSLNSIRRSFLMGGLGEPKLELEENSSVFEPGSFDLIVWAPPFIQGQGQASRERRFLYSSADSLKEVLATLPPLLDRGGRILIPYPEWDASTLGPALLTELGLRFGVLRREQFRVTGPVRLYCAWLPRRGEQAGEVEPGKALPGAAWVLRDR
ncbi:MAG: methyltransferase [Myxococcota bacterium]|nr:methyltransferase [Myxococcota bacterium]